MVRCLLALLVALVVSQISLGEAGGSLSVIETFTTSDGTTLEGARLKAIEGDVLVIQHKKGVSRILLNTVPDEYRREWGLPTTVFERAQRERGLVEIDGEWMRKEEADERILNARIADLLDSNSESEVACMVLQILPDGLLCRRLQDSPIPGRGRQGSPIFVAGGYTGLVAENESFRNDLFWAGSYSLLTDDEEIRTIPCYTLNRALAFEILKESMCAPSDSMPDSEADRRSQIPGLDRDVSGFGTGFIITADGFILTCAHVVKKSRHVEVYTENGLLPVVVIATDREEDIALLKANGRFAPLGVMDDVGVKLGANVFTLGFPRPNIQGFSPKVTRGVISGMSGIKDNPNLYQIDAAVQPGNSGGPVLDFRGNVIGMVKSMLDDVNVLRASGAIPQNVNYAIKGSRLRRFLSKQPEVYEALVAVAEGQEETLESCVEKTTSGIALVIVH